MTNSRTRKKPSLSILQATFQSLAAQLDAAFHGTTIGRGKAPSRTASNREQLVLDFLKGVLPLSVQARQGAVLIDSLGQESRDVDVVLLNPWAAPVWPYQHGIVPVEGALVAVFVEREWPVRHGSTVIAPIYEQASSAKALLKWLLKTEGYGVPARRTYRVETGIWVWFASAFKGNTKDLAVAIMTDLLKNWAPFEKALSSSCQRAREAQWTSPALNPEQMSGEYESYQHEVGAMAPNWIYVHNLRLFLLKFQARAGSEPRAYDDIVMVSSRPDGLVLPVPAGQRAWSNTPTCVEEGSDLERQAFRKWGYAYFGGENALQTLAFQLAFAVNLYGKERTNFGAYLRRAVF